MHPIDKEIEAATAMLRAQGGLIHLDPNAPDDIKRAFLQMLMDCPDCREKMKGKKDAHAH